MTVWKVNYLSYLINRNAVSRYATTTHNITLLLFGLTTAKYGTSAANHHDQKNVPLLFGNLTRQRPDENVKKVLTIKAVP